MCTSQHKEHLRQTYVKHHHYHLFGMLALSSGNGITCPFYRHSNWDSGRLWDVPKVTVSPKPRTSGSPLYTSQNHIPAWNLPKLFMILLILLDPLIPPNSKGKRQPMLNSEEKPELGSFRRKSNTSRQHDLLRTRASEIIFSTKQKREALMNPRAAVIYSRQECWSFGMFPTYLHLIHTCWGPSIHLQMR